MTRLAVVLLLLVWSARAQAQPLTSDLAERWRAGGQYFSWTSTLPENAGRSVQIFYTCIGDAAKPTILALHGFPTSSLDFRGLARELQPDYRTCTLDFPGYGVSDKPLNYRYTLADDAALVWAFVTKVVPLREFVLLSHDRGDSVALNLLQLYQASATPPFHITHQFLTNGNMYLPLANLTDFQKRMLDPATAPVAARSVTLGLLAVGLGQSNYTPSLKADDAEVQALAAQFAYQNGIGVIPATIQYLNERKEREVTFLETLA
ncbi:MAG: alpha/beta hydrolase, partial [Vicinamibacterales bacterium]